MLELGKQFRPSTSVVYPPFKRGKYMEEYFYEYVTTHNITSSRVYIPIFWTNLQIHPGFSSQKQKYELLLSNVLSKMPKNTTYFTVVQHDDGPQLTLPKNTLIFGACSGSIPLPLIYEDTNETLQHVLSRPKKYLASFIGSDTHRIRTKISKLEYPDIYISSNKWASSVPQNLSTLFIEKTVESKFCLAPRGYGRSSFRFFEAILLNVIPVYFWDDIEWLPYKNILDYPTFSVSIHEKDIPRTYEILASISNETYESMVEELKKVKHYFTLEKMSQMIMEHQSAII